ncbi:MAG: hypothetical protein ACREM2_06080 [Vulcanimicrobiaceae bacterium]
MGSRRRAAVVTFGLAGIAVAVGACSGGGGGGSSPPTVTPVPITKEFTDATMLPPPTPSAYYTPVAGTRWQIVSVQTTLQTFPAPNGDSQYRQLVVTTTYAQPIAAFLPPPGQLLNSPTEFGQGTGIVLTPFPAGSVPYQGSCPGTGPNAVAFVESALIDNRNADGSYPLTYQGGIGGSVPTVASGNTITQTIDLSDFGLFPGSVPQLSVWLIADNGAGGNGFSGIATSCSPPNGTFQVSP